MPKMGCISTSGFEHGSLSYSFSWVYRRQIRSAWSVEFKVTELRLSMLSAPQELMLGLGKLMTVMTILMTSVISRMMGKISSFFFLHICFAGMQPERAPRKHCCWVRLLLQACCLADTHGQSCVRLLF